MPPSLVEVLDDGHRSDRCPRRGRHRRVALGVLEPDAAPGPNGSMSAIRTRDCGRSARRMQGLLRAGRAHRAAPREVERGRTGGAVPRRGRAERRREVLGRACGLAPALRSGGLGDLEPGRRDRDVPRRPSVGRVGGGARAGRGAAADPARRPPRGGSRGLLEAVDRIAPADAELVLVVDQFEELFTLTTDERGAGADPGSVARRDRRSESRLRVIVTLRADFYDRPLMYPRFGELLAARNETVPPLTADELEQAIRRPAEAAGHPPRAGSRRRDDRRRRAPARRRCRCCSTRSRSCSSDGTRTADVVGVPRDRRGDGRARPRGRPLFSAADADGRRAIEQVFLRLVTLGEGRQDTRRRVATASSTPSTPGGAVEAALEASAATGC